MLISGILLVLTSRLVSAKDVVACEYKAKHSSIYPVSHLDPLLCSHIIFSSMLVNETTHKASLQDPRHDITILTEIAHLRPKNPDIKLLISLSGNNDNSRAFKEVLVLQSRRMILIGSIIDMLTKYDYDGINLDVDIEDPSVKEEFEMFLSELRGAVKDVKFITISPSRRPVEASKTDVSTISKFADLLFIKSYSYHQPEQNMTQLSHPLFGAKIGDGSVNQTVSSWLTSGMPPGRIVLGIDMIGPIWSLFDIRDNGIGALGRFAGSSSLPGACLGYRRTMKCRMDSLQQGNYCQILDAWLSIEMPLSIKEKAKYIFSRGLGGGMIWNFIYDDHSGICGMGSTLTQELKDTLKDIESQGFHHQM